MSAKDARHLIVKFQRALTIVHEEFTAAGIQLDFQEGKAECVARTSRKGVAQAKASFVEGGGQLLVPHHDGQFLRVVEMCMHAGVITVNTSAVGPDLVASRAAHRTTLHAIGKVALREQRLALSSRNMIENACCSTGLLHAAGTWLGLIVKLFAQVHASQR